MTLLSETNYARVPKQQSLKSPLLLWITGGEILHHAFYSYLPPGASAPLWQRACLCLCLFISLSTSSSCVSVRGGVGKMERQCVPVQKSLHALVA